MGNKHPNTNEVGKSGLTVSVRNNNVETAVRLLKRKVKAEGLERDLRAKEAYEKPTWARRRRIAESRRRWHKTRAMLSDELGMRVG